MRGLIAEPVLLVLVIGVIGTLVILRNRTAGLVIVASAFLLLYLLSTSLVSERLLAVTQVSHLALSERYVEQENPQAIVVLSAGRYRSAPEYSGDTVDGVTLERLRYAAHVARKTNLPVLVAGGRHRAGDTPLAHLMREVLEEDWEVAVRWVEDRSRNTFENALLSAEILRNQSIDSVILVTHAFHMKRAMEAFEQMGIRVVPASTVFALTDSAFQMRDLLPYASNLVGSAYALHELVGLVAYRLISY